MFFKIAIALALGSIVASFGWAVMYGPENLDMAFRLLIAALGFMVVSILPDIFSS